MKDQRPKSARGRGSSHNSSVSGSPPSSPNGVGCYMQLRDASERRPSRLYDDSFELPNLTSKTNQQGRTPQVPLERTPQLTGQVMPELQPYMCDVTDNNADQVESCSPPALLPEVIVTRSTKQRQAMNDQQPSTMPSLIEETKNNDCEKKSNTEGKTILPGISFSHSFSLECDSNKDTKPPLILEDDEYEEINSLTDSRWSDSLDELFKEPERVSTGKEEKTTIDGVDFLSFESREDLDEFTAMDIDYVHSYRNVDIEDENIPVIIPTKTTDITKIKGWRTKFFAGNDNYETSKLDIAIEKNDCTIVSNDITKGVSLTDHVPAVDKGKKLKMSKKSPVTNRKDYESVDKMEDGRSKQECGNSSQTHSDLNKSWVEFAVSALVVPGESPVPEKEKNDGATSEEILAALENKSNLGRPINFPLSYYMKRKLNIPCNRKKGRKSNVAKSPPPAPPVKSVTATTVKPPAATYERESDHKIMQAVKKTVNQLLLNVEAFVELHSAPKMIEVSACGKMKANRELKRLGHVMIDIEQKVKAYDTQSETKIDCTEEFCKLGCVCSSLNSASQAMGHCGKVECMFECKCTTLPNVAIERMIEDEKRDLAPAEKDFCNTLIKSDSGIMMLNQRGRREIKMPKHLRDMLTGDALLAVDHRLSSGRGAAKNKALKDYQDECKKTAQMSLKQDAPRVRKSLLKDSNYMQNSPEKGTACQFVDEYFNIPSPEILEEPSDDHITRFREAHDLKSALYDENGGFITVDSEEKFLASQKIKIKEEKNDNEEVPDAGVNSIEIDDMGWQRLGNDGDFSGINSEGFGKIVSVKSLAHEEFESCQSIAPEIPPEISPYLEQKKENVESLLNPDSSKEPLSNITVMSPRHKRIAAKLRAKRLAEFFTTATNVSMLVKSANEFKPALLQKDAITLLQWSSLKARFNARTINLWVKNSPRDFHFLVTETADLPLPGYTNLFGFKLTNATLLPEVARQMQQSYTSVVDSQRCCILWCNGSHWEFIGTLLKSRGSLPSTLPSHAKPRVIPNTITLPKEAVKTKWYSILLRNDFEAIELKNEDMFIPYSKVSQIMNAAWKLKKTVYFEITSRNNKPQQFIAPYGLYSQPNDYKYVYVGPYTTRDHPLLELVPYEGVICKSAISPIYVDADPKLAHLAIPETPENVGTLPDKVTTPVTPSGRRSVGSGDSPKGYVSSRGRVRKVPKYLLEEYDESTELSTTAIIKVKRTSTDSLKVANDKNLETVELRLDKRKRKFSVKDKQHKEEDNVHVDSTEDMNAEPESVQSFVKVRTDLSEKVPVTEISSATGADDCDVEGSSSDDEIPLAKKLQSIQKQEEKSKQAIMAQLKCDNTDISYPIPIAVYKNGSVRLRNPFGRRVGHFENLDLAKRFLSYIHERACNIKDLVWTLDGWDAKNVLTIKESLLSARARLIPTKSLNQAIGSEGRTRPVRVKWKPHKKKERSSVQRIIDECDENGSFQDKNVALRQAHCMANKYVIRIYQQQSLLKTSIDSTSPPQISPECPQEAQLQVPQTYGVPEECEIPEKYALPLQCEIPEKNGCGSDVLQNLSNNVFDGKMFASNNKAISYSEEDNDSQCSQESTGRTLKNHKASEKARRKSLSDKFRHLSSLLMLTEQSSKLSKLLVLDMAIDEVARVKRIEDTLTGRRKDLEEKRVQNFAQFSAALEGLDRKSKMEAVSKLKELLQSKPLPKDEVYYQDEMISTDHVYEQPMPPKNIRGTIIMKLVPIKSKMNQRKPRHAVKLFKETPEIESEPRLPPVEEQAKEDVRKEEIVEETIVQSETCCVFDDAMEHVEIPHEILENEEVVYERAQEGKQGVAPNARSVVGPLHELFNSSEKRLGEKHENLPCHVRISKDGNAQYPVSPPSSSDISLSASRGRVLLKRKMVLTNPKEKKSRLFGYQTLPTPLVDYIDITNNSMLSTKKKRTSEDWQSRAYLQECDDSLSNGSEDNSSDRNIAPNVRIKRLDHPLQSTNNVFSHKVEIDAFNSDNSSDGDAQASPSFSRDVEMSTVPSEPCKTAAFLPVLASNVRIARKMVVKNVHDGASIPSDLLCKSTNLLSVTPQNCSSDTTLFDGVPPLQPISKKGSESVRTVVRKGSKPLQSIIKESEVPMVEATEINNDSPSPSSVTDNQNSMSYVAPRVHVNSKSLGLQHAVQIAPTNTAMQPAIAFGAKLDLLKAAECAVSSKASDNMILNPGLTICKSDGHWIINDNESKNPKNEIFEVTITKVGQKPKNTNAGIMKCAPSSNASATSHGESDASKLMRNFSNNDSFNSEINSFVTMKPFDKSLPSALVSGSKQVTTGNKMKKYIAKKVTTSDLDSKIGSSPPLHKMSVKQLFGTVTIAKNIQELACNSKTNVVSNSSGQVIFSESDFVAPHDISGSIVEKRSDSNSTNSVDPSDSGPETAPVERVSSNKHDSKKTKLFKTSSRRSVCAEGLHVTKTSNKNENALSKLDLETRLKRLAAQDSLVIAKNVVPSKKNITMLKSITSNTNMTEISSSEKIFINSVSEIAASDTPINSSVASTIFQPPLVENTSSSNNMDDVNKLPNSSECDSASQTTLEGSTSKVFQETRNVSSVCKDTTPETDAVNKAEPAPSLAPVGHYENADAGHSFDGSSAMGGCVATDNTTNLTFDAVAEPFIYCLESEATNKALQSSSGSSKFIENTNGFNERGVGGKQQSGVEAHSQESTSFSAGNLGSQATTDVEIEILEIGPIKTQLFQKVKKTQKMSSIESIQLDGVQPEDGEPEVLVMYKKSSLGTKKRRFEAKDARIKKRQSVPQCSSPKFVVNKELMQAKINAAKSKLNQV